MPNYNASRYQRWLVQQQSALLAFNNSTGTWTTTGNQIIRVDQGSVQTTRNAPYNRFPVLTGTRSEVAGIRGRKLASWSMRGVPVIPSGAAGTVPDMDIILQNMFGQAATVSAGVSATYSFLDSGYLPFSLFGFAHGISTLTHRGLWGCFVSRATFTFNQNFLVADLEGFAGYQIDNVGFSTFDTQAKAGLTAFPTEPTASAIAGNPIAGFGNGYTATFHSQGLTLKIRSLSITYETGFTPITDIYGSPYMVAVVGDARRISVRLTALDDDSSALNDLKTQADTDNTTITGAVVAGSAAGSIATFNLAAIQPNAFNLRDNGPSVDTELPDSYAHATAVGNVDDSTIVFT